MPAEPESQPPNQGGGPFMPAPTEEPRQPLAGSLPPPTHATAQPGASVGFKQWTATRAPRDHVKLGIAVAATVLLLAILAGWSTRPKPRVTYLVNALGIPVVIEFGDDTVPLEPHSYIEGAFKNGTYEVTARDTVGTVLSTEMVEIPDGDYINAYNTLGAADVYFDKIEYVSGCSPGSTRPMCQQSDEYYVLHIGETFVSYPDIDFAFIEPPNFVDSTSRRTLRRFLGFIDPGDWGWQCSLDVLVTADRGADAQTLAETIDRYDPTASAQLYLDSVLANPPQYEDEYQPSYGRYPY